MRLLTINDFSRRVGKPFEVEVQGGRLPLTLDAAQELPSMGRTGGSFRLEFSRPAPADTAAGHLSVPHRRRAARPVHRADRPGHEAARRYEAIFV